ncbi:hypothetical protein HPB50_018639 [Hyalomma asiaticum]|uniref:Uncharacterized protein n=1 Tax=Hyalomma asiaticum TaxID=266040 RepID=A0ACB7T0I2_HYAAI|nr:hypothetical protein HPB50_018639 [Hyalomma asiaticum]
MRPVPETSGFLSPMQQTGTAGRRVIPTLTTRFVPVVEHQIQMKVVCANLNASYAMRTIPPQTRHAKPNSRSPSLLSRGNGKGCEWNDNKNMKTLSQEKRRQSLALSGLGKCKGTTLEIKNNIKHQIEISIDPSILIPFWLQ